MQKYKQEFIEFMVKSNVLRFGEFVTKSGRQTPFFINTGNYTTGEQLEKLGEFYAQTIKERIGTELDSTKKVVIVEDVMTAGNSIYETAPILKAQGDVEICGLVISVDRMEKGKGEQSAQSEIKEAFGITTYPIVTMAEVVEYLYNREIDGTIYIDDTIKEAIAEYYKKYGV